RSPSPPRPRPARRAAARPAARGRAEAGAPGGAIHAVAVAAVVWPSALRLLRLRDRRELDSQTVRRDRVDGRLEGSRERALRQAALKAALDRVEIGPAAGCLSPGVDREVPRR